MIKSNTSHIGFEDTKYPMGVEAVLPGPGEPCPRTRFIRAETLVLADCVIPPAPAGPSIPGFLPE